MIGSVLHVVTACLGLMLLVAAFGKADGWPRWAAASRAFFPGRPLLARVLRVSVPVAEVVVGVLVFIRPLAGLIAAAGLLCVFAAGVLWLAPRSGRTNCNCFGALMPSELGRGLALRNVALAGLAALAAGGVARRGAPVFTPVEGLVLLVIATNALVVVEMKRLPGERLRGASELKPRDR